MISTGFSGSGFSAGSVNTARPQFSASDKDLLKAKKIKDSEILKAKKQAEKEAKAAKKQAEKEFEQTDAGQKERVAKKARNRFFIKSYAKTLWTIPASVVATVATGGALLPLIPVSIGANLARASVEGVAYIDTMSFQEETALNTFSRAKQVRKKTEYEFDELKRRAEALQENTKQPDEAADSVDFILDEKY